MAWCHFFWLDIFAGLLILTMGQDPTRNFPPSWDTSSFNILTLGIVESTPVGTSLCQLKCNDNEGDPINYALLSGNSVNVDKNGLVTLAITLDFEQTNPLGYDLTFSCVDINAATGFPIHQAVTTNLQITVNDANDNKPLFQVSNQQGYAFSISENAKNGTLVEASIQTRDADRTVNAALKTMYLICNSPNATEKANIPESSKAFCEKFVLTYMQISEGVYNASVYLNGVLDYEQRPVYTSIIVAIDGPGLPISLTSTVNIQINLIDAQDQLPFFTNQGDTTTISEGAPIGSTVMNFAISARDGDLGDKRAINLSIVSDPKNAFDLTYAAEVTRGEGIYSSQLIIKNQLDRETNIGPYFFVIKATEMNSSQLTLDTATATYSLYVSDINDNPPLFSQSVYPINVTELDFNIDRNSTMQITGLQIICYDLDEAANAKYTVTIIRQTIGQGPNAIDVTDAYSISPDLPFFIGNASLYLKVNNQKYLDYDNVLYRVQTVVLVARESPDGRPNYSSSTTVSISLQDINDNAPIFYQTSYVINISEAEIPPKDLLTITASDKDEGINGKVAYSLEGGFSGKFSIDSATGVLRLIAPLDFETASEFVFLVLAKDQGIEPKSSQVQVTVLVTNANDLAPKFRQSQYQTSVNESSLVFLNPLNIIAVDDEAGTQQITYKIVSGQSTNNAFVINPTTGELTLRAFLDFADTPRDANGRNTGVYILAIEASDNGNPPLTSRVNVNIVVIDENNHPPVLNPTVYYAVLNETAPEGTPVVKVMGTDADTGDNGKLSFRLGAGSTDNFAVIESTGMVIVGPAGFDYNVQNRYILLIIATDGGAPQKSATATIYVNVTDVNNKDPYFDVLLYLVNVDDRSPVGTVVQTVPAYDSDSTARLQYSIVINSITAKDPNGGPIVNDVPYNFRTAFGVNAAGGIYIANKLDHTIMAETSFQLAIRDLNTQQGVGTSTTQVIIIIKGAVDKSITFDSVSQVFINEDAPIGYSPITVTARDPNNQRVTSYNKVNGSRYFGVDSFTGAIRLVQIMDYEKDTTPDHLHLVVIVATSQSGDQSATVTVTISIVDVNDNIPQFLQPTYTAQISESAVYPTLVVIISATDADSKSYGPLDFSLAGLGADDFQIFVDRAPGGTETSRQGQVIVAQNKILDYNRRNRYDLTLIVADNQQNSQSVHLSSAATLTINIIDENNNYPVFLGDPRTVEIADTTPVGSTITTIIATDQDQGANGYIIYSLEPTGPTSSADSQLFSIDRISGAVNVAQSLLKNSNQVIYLRVRASDSGIKPNVNYTSLTIIISSTENNDGNPKWLFPPSGYIFYAPEETANYTIRDKNNNSRVFNVTARTGTQIVFMFSKTDPINSKFSINNATGEITTKEKLDREIQATYELLVFAGDTNNTDRYKTSRSVTLILWDINDNDALFTNFNPNYKSCQPTERPIEVSVEENMAANVTVYTLKACDPDSPEYSQINYLMYNGNENCSKYNNISGVTADLNGQLVTRRTIDYEQNKEFIICVQAVSVVPISTRQKRAYDASQFQPYQDNVAYVHINIIDVNDNGPTFPHKTNNGIVQTNPGTSPILVVNATDVDGPGNNVVLYHIESSVFYPQGDAPPGPFDGAFVLRGDRGAIYAARPSYQEYSGGRFVLKIVATDRANNSLTDSQEVTIYVYEKGQAVKVILDLKPETGSQYGQIIVDQLDDVTGRYQFIFLRVSEHITQNSIDTSRTDVCFLIVDTTSKDMLDVRQVIELLDQSRYQDVLKKPEYHFIDEGQCFPSQSSESSIKWRNLWWVLVAVAIFVFVCCVILIILISILYDRYKRFMETRKTYLVSQ